MFQNGLKDRMPEKKIKNYFYCENSCFLLIFSVKTNAHEDWFLWTFLFMNLVQMVIFLRFFKICAIV